jgi:hypothetical protein
MNATLSAQAANLNGIPYKSSKQYIDKHGVTFEEAKGSFL